MGTTAEVLGHHLGAIGDGDFDQIMADYADDATLFTPDGVFNGIGEIKGFFGQFMAQLTPEFMEALNFDSEEVDGEYAYLTWHAGDAAPFGTDTFHIVDGKIVMQSFAAYMPS